MADPRKRLDEMIEALRGQNFRLTPQRLEILRILASSREHPSVEQVFEEVRRRFPTTSLATVYRNILKLKELGQVLDGFCRGRQPYAATALSPILTWCASGAAESWIPTWKISRT